MNPDDPKLTAYALDELDPAERAEIDTLLRENPAALAEVEETERLIAQLRRELATEPATPLRAEQRAEIFAVADLIPSQPANDAMLGAEHRFPTCAAGGNPSRRTEQRHGMPLATQVENLRSARWSRPMALAASIAVLAGATYLGLQLIPKPTIASLALAPAPAPTLLLAKPEEQFAANLPIATASEGVSPEEMLAPSESPLPGVSADNGKSLFAKNELSPATAEKTKLSGGGKASSNFTSQFSLADATGSAADQDADGFKNADEFGVPANNQTRTRGGGDVELAFNRTVQKPAATPKAVNAATAVDASAVGAAQSAMPSPREATAFTMSKAMPTAGRVNSPTLQDSSRGAREKSANDSQASPVSGPALPPHFEAPQIPQGFGDSGKRVAGLGPSSSPVSPTPPTEFVNESRTEFGISPAKPSAPSQSVSTGEKSLGDVPLLGHLLRENVESNEREPSDTEAYDTITDNAFLAVGENPLSTFSIDVDTASYSNVRRFLSEQRLPPKGAVRIEELINYFTYDYPQPEGNAPFSASMEVAACPWTPEHRLVRIGLKGREIAPDKRPATNLVFLIDVSGSMNDENKLPLVKKCLRQLVDKMGDEDSVAIAVYAGASGCVLEPTNKKSEMRRALDRLESGGSTNGAAGIQLAYQLAERSFIKGGVNRVILATDGDFNVGVTNQSDLTELIEKKAKSGVFLTVLGFGMGNLKDSTLEKLADKGNGNYAYIDTYNEGRKVLVEQMSGTLVTIAKDVKIQVEFNPAQVGSYRLIGYENRMLKKEDFNDDTKDAGEIGAGHTVTALYEVVSAGTKPPGAPGVDALKYQEPIAASEESKIQNPKSKISPELLTLKLRYKAPDGDTSKLLEFPLTDDGKTYERSSKDFRFAAAVASFGMLLRDSPHKGSANWNSTLELAQEGKGEDRSGYRAEFVSLIERAKAASR